MSTGSLLNSQIGEYRLIDFLGAGGMGEVYRAVHSKLGRVVAVKVLTSAARNPSLVDRFFNEARIQSNLHHPNIATLFDFSEFGGRPCIIMEYIDGQTLDERIRMFGGLPLSETVFIFQALVEALSYVHGQGIIHRDIKPNNVKISSAGEVKLLDFGIAKGDATPNLTVTGDVVGTLQYLSPEQLKGGFADARSDIWALGVLLYEMATGRVPFEAQTIGVLYEKIIKAEFLPPRTINPAVPHEMEAIIMRCLRKNPADRYQSAQVLRAEALNLSRLVSTPRLSSVENQTPLGQTGWKNSSVLLLAAASFLVLAIIVAVIWIVAQPGLNNGNEGQGGNTTLGSATGGQKGGGVLQTATPTPTPAVAVTTQNPGQSGMISINVAFGGPAQVYVNDKLVGTTPYQYQGSVGETIHVVLKQAGFQDKVPAPITITQLPQRYDFTLEKEQ